MVGFSSSPAGRFDLVARRKAWCAGTAPLTAQSSALCVIAFRGASGPVGLCGSSLAFRPGES